MKNWRTVNIRVLLLAKIEEVVARNVDPSITSPNQFIDLALREKLERLEATNA